MAKKSFAEFCLVFDNVKANTLVFLYFFGILRCVWVYFSFHIKTHDFYEGGKQLTSNHSDFSEHFQGLTPDKNVIEFLEDRFRKRVDSQLENGKVKLLVFVDEPKENLLQSLRKKTQEHVQQEHREAVLNPF